MPNYMTVAGEEDDDLVVGLNAGNNDSLGMPKANKADDDMQNALSSVLQQELDRRVKLCRYDYDARIREADIRKAQEIQFLQKMRYCKSDHDPVAKR